MEMQGDNIHYAMTLVNVIMEASKSLLDLLT